MHRRVFGVATDVSPTFGEDLRAGVRKGLRDIVVWPPLPTAIAWILCQASLLLFTLTLAVISSWPIAHPEIALYVALPAAVLFAVAWGLSRRKRWAWLLGLALEVGATLAFGLFVWLATEPTLHNIRVNGFRAQPAWFRMIVWIVLSLMAFGPALYGLLHPATRAALRRPGHPDKAAQGPG